MSPLCARRAHHGRVRGRVAGVEVERLHVAADGLQSSSAAASRPADGRAARTTRRPPRAAHFSTVAKRDVAGAAEDEHGLGGAEGVDHAVLPSSGQRVRVRRDRSDMKTPSGSRRLRAAWNSAQARVHRCDRLGSGARVLGQVDPAARRRRPAGRGGRAAPARRRGRRQVERESPARDRERQRAAVGRAEPLQHRQERRQAGRRDPARRCRAATSSAPNGTTNWYCTKPRRPVHAVPVADRRRAGGRTRRSAASWPRRDARRLAEPQLVEGADRHLVDQPGRHERRRARRGVTGRRRARVSRSRSRSS